MNLKLEDRPAYLALRREWAIMAGLMLVFSRLLYAILRAEWDATYAVRWLAAVLVVQVYLHFLLWRQISANRRKTPENAPLLSTFGLANRITIARAALATGLAGFLFGPWPPGILAWIPGLLFTAVSLMDFLDGYAARATGMLTRLGEQLDMQWDCIAVLFAVFLLARYQQVPVVYVLVGLMRYIYLFGLWLHARRGGSLRELPPNRFRRVVGGMQMGFICVALLPIFTPPVTQIVAVIFMLPVLWGFTRDFLAVTGRISGAPPKRSSLWLRAEKALPLVLRIVLSILLISAASAQIPGLPLRWGIVLLAAAAALAILFGAAGRLAALLVLAGLGLQTAPLDWRYWAILLSSVALFFTGTGAYSLWRPEDWLIDHQAGEARRQLAQSKD